MKYKVTIVRTSYSTKEFEVDAESEQDATDKALQEACNTVFSDDSADYDVEDCVEVE
jgi:hypothetical protein